jgi:hypothetical protein
VINIILLIKTPLAGQLIFFIALLYIGVQWMILFYAIRYINKLQTPAQPSLRETKQSG